MKSRLPSAGRRVRPAVARLRSALAPALAPARRLAARYAATRPGRALAALGPAAAAAAAVVVIAVLLGSVEGTDRMFVVMGFDADRAQLITSLIVGATAAAAATLVGSRVLAASLLGLAGAGVLYAQTFAGQTGNALKATGPAGAFDAVGWVLTVVTLLVMGTIAAWIGATLAVSVRPALIATGGSTVSLIRWAVAALRGSPAARPDRQSMTRPVVALLIILLLAICLPVFNDMVNLSPDSPMLNGAPRQPAAASASLAPAP